jgi:hypothetical protein
MLKETAVKIPEEETRNRESALQPDVPDDCPREPFKIVDDPGSEPEPAGYGHGV